MKINFKARFKNKAFVVSLTALAVSFAYKLLALAEIVPAVSENEVMELLSLGVNVLVLLGVVIDPTTQGLSDSDKAMTYYCEEDTEISV